MTASCAICARPLHVRATGRSSTSRGRKRSGSTPSTWSCRPWCSQATSPTPWPRSRAIARGSSTRPETSTRTSGTRSSKPSSGPTRGAPATAGWSRASPGRCDTCRRPCATSGTCSPSMRAKFSTRASPTGARTASSTTWSTTTPRSPRRTSPRCSRSPLSPAPATAGCPRRTAGSAATCSMRRAPGWMQTDGSRRCAGRRTSTGRGPPRRHRRSSCWRAAPSQRLES